jgi:aldehyde:ferredoxin oxidoreductase
VYLAIDDESLQIKDASGVWGCNVRKTTDELKKFGRVACIGRAGERLVRISSIMNDYVHTCGRGGLGAVMGSKKLKAITVRGSHKPQPVNPEAFEVAKREAMRLLRASPVLKGLNAYGTSVLVNLMNYMHILPTANFNYTHFERAEYLSGEYLQENFELKNHACANCFVACKHSDKRENIEIPEYESLWALGPDNQNSDIKIILKANRICNDYGIDTISAGSTIACYSEITSKNTSPEKIPELIKAIGEKTDIGSELSEGSKIYAARQGKPELSMSAKGLEFPGYDPRGVLGQALGYATSNRGGCHLRAYMVAPEIIGKPKLIDRTTFRGKAGLVNIFQNFSAASDSLILCKFATFALSEEECANLLSAATGYEYSSEEFLLIGERIWNLERLYNLKAGLTSEDDTLPPRFFEGGIDREEFQKTLQEYYRYRGWNSKGIPTRAKLKQLNILNYGGEFIV